VPGYPPGPPPPHRVEIWLGVYKPRGLRLAGRVADGWVPSIGYLGIDAAHKASKVIDEAALAAGREPAAIRRVYNIGGLITDGPSGEGTIVGPVGQWVETLAEWAVDPGIDAFIFWPTADELRQVERFAAEVAPAVRDVLAAR
jgi:alkanesulfonate monooxygenase SsuD/methylene tetrahydromethanopterin reductase-like flavin-dependent oxidoreductase (luciferase family)